MRDFSQNTISIEMESEIAELELKTINTMMHKNWQTFETQETRYDLASTEVTSANHVDMQILASFSSARGIRSEVVI
ncbi:Uncharacterised protein [Vibrio mimicus]|uniref:hypothetical protein n=1 Tax=Vibrio mimicus TaxID=674 RepID=UPI0002BAC2E4|nr:hypothetical protein [Vibrio mimicus]EMB49215.1 hypothetical protein D908_13878 [Vibrio mimicus CAIM 602]TXY31383.1 hypothetical protein FXE86_08365 [Vibrio mimicus]SUQ22686.1 Uncharacterised protein [Vibrio mimicus]